jgi:PEP-CTERM motif
MKMKLAVAFAVLFFATLARADSTQITVDATATGCECPEFAPVAPISLQAQFTVEAVTGTFFDSGLGFLFTGTEYEVLGMTGTLNGSPMTLAAAPRGIGSWLYEANGDFLLGSVYFTSDGSFSWLENDGSYDLLNITDVNGDGGGTDSALLWNAVDPGPANTPEPTTYAMLMMGLVGLLARRRLLSN